MIELKQHDDASLVIQATWSQDLYIVPQQHNTLYIGASIEDKGFDEAITVAEIFNLLRQAIMIYPSIREASIIKTWSGFRAGSMDHAPVLCHDKQNKKIIWATGHHRNGILLAPLTAKAIKQLLLSGNVPEIWQGYGYDRWQ
jgi:glycine oxidase